MRLANQIGYSKLRRGTALSTADGNIWDTLKKNLEIARVSSEVLGAILTPLTWQMYIEILGGIDIGSSKGWENNFG